MLRTIIAQVAASPVVRRPRSLSEWRTGGLDYAVDKAIDVAGVLVAIFTAWMFLRFVARRIEAWGHDAKDTRNGQDLMHLARAQRARTAANLVRSFGRAVLTIVGVLMV